MVRKRKGKKEIRGGKEGVERRGWIAYAIVRRKHVAKTGKPKKLGDEELALVNGGDERKQKRMGLT